MNAKQRKTWAHRERKRIKRSCTKSDRRLAKVQSIIDRAAALIARYGGT